MTDNPAGAGNARVQDDVAVYAVAIRNRAGRVFALPQPYRHHDVIRHMANLGEPVPVTGEQGFLVGGRGFADRTEARQFAEKAGQILEGRGCLPELYSEDLW